MHRDPCHHFCEASVAGFFVLASTPTGTQIASFLCGATMVPAQDTLCVHRSDYPVLTFWRLEFFLNEHDVAPKDLQQPDVGLFLNPSRTIPNAVVASDLNRHVATQTEVIQNRLQSHHFCRCSHHRCQFGLSTAQGQNSLSFGHKLTTPHRHSSHCGFSRGVACSKVCVAKHLNIAVQLSPCTSAGHSGVFDCVSSNSLEGG